MSNYSKNIIEPKIINGDIFFDNRGSITFVNDFRLDEFKRFYIIQHKKINTIRAWQAHKIETKVFFSVQGDFLIQLIKIENWVKPNKRSKTIKFKLSDNDTKILIVPGGYANGFINTVENAKLLVFSSLSLKDSISDDYRYDKDYFISCNWGNYT